MRWLKRNHKVDGISFNNFSLQKFPAFIKEKLLQKCPALIKEKLLQKCPALIKEKLLHKCPALIKEKILQKCSALIKEKLLQKFPAFIKGKFIQKVPTPIKEKLIVLGKVPLSVPGRFWVESNLVLNFCEKWVSDEPPTNSDGRFGMSHLFAYSVEPLIFLHLGAQNSLKAFIDSVYIITLLENQALLRVLIVIPAVYPHLTDLPGN